VNNHRTDGKPHRITLNITLSINLKEHKRAPWPHYFAFVGYAFLGVVLYFMILVVLFVFGVWSTPWSLALILVSIVLGLVGAALYVELWFTHLAFQSDTTEVGFGLHLPSPLLVLYLALTGVYDDHPVSVRGSGNQSEPQDDD
jgi:glucan phosphoethanolaminetransferase (alkaline phosphatase superfamily)